MVSMLELAQKVEALEGKTNHLLVRSELTLYVLSALVANGTLKREGVEELIRDSKFNAPNISDAIVQKEKEIVSTLLGKVKIV